MIGRVWILAAALTASCASSCGRQPSKYAGQDYDPAMPPLPFLFGVAARVRDAPSGKVIQLTDCGTKLYVHEREHASTRISVIEHRPPYDIRAEVKEVYSGWIDDEDLEISAKAALCTGPLYVYDARVGARRAARTAPPMLVEADPDPGAAAPPRRFWRIRGDDDGLRSCVESRIEGEALVEATEGAGTVQRVTWGFNAMGGGLFRMTGPTVEEVDGAGRVVDPSKAVSYLCLHDELVVSRSRDVLVLINAWGFSGTPFAYAPQSASRWYTSREACERTLGPGPRAKGVARHGCG